MAESDSTQLIELLAKLSKSPAIQELLTSAVGQASQSPAAAQIALAAMAASGHKDLPPAWATALADLLTSDSTHSLTSDALAALRAVPPAKVQAEKIAAALQKVGDSANASETRLAALAIIPGGAKNLSENQCDLLLKSIDREQPATIRGTAADVLSKAKLSPAQLAALSKRLPTANPLELDRLLSAFAQSTDRAVGLAVLSALAAPELRAALTVEPIRQRLAKYDASVQAEAQKLYAQIDADHAHQSQRLEEALSTLPPGDIRRGQELFNSTKVSCRNCHTIGYVGGRIGPDLTRIGQIRQSRDLVESIMFPSASFVRSYEPVLIRTGEGQVYSGNIKKDAPDEVVLTLAADKEARIPRGEIEEMLPGKVSVMPAGLDKQLSLQELADIVEFLRNCK